MKIPDGNSPDQFPSDAEELAERTVFYEHARELRENFRAWKEMLKTANDSILNMLPEQAREKLVEIQSTFEVCTDGLARLGAEFVAYRDKFVKSHNDSIGGPRDMFASLAGLYSAHYELNLVAIESVRRIEGIVRSKDRDLGTE